MSTLAPQPASHPVAYRALLLLNLAIMLLPPVHLLLTGGNMTLALTYVIGGPLVLVVSMFVLGRLDGTRNAEDF